MGRESCCADAECPGRGSWELRVLPLLLPSLLPALGALRKPRGSLGEAQESCGSPRGGLARGQRGGGVTQGCRCHPEVAVSPRGANVTQCREAAGALSGAPCTGFGKREREEEFILSSCQSITSQRLLRLPLVASSPRCAQCWRLQNSPCPGRGITAAPKSHH